MLQQLVQAGISLLPLKIQSMGVSVFVLIFAALVITPSNLFWVFVLWGCLFLLVNYLVIRKANKALNEITCALFSDGKYRENLSKESKVYEIIAELVDENQIYEGMTTDELDNLLKNRCKDSYDDLNFWMHFDGIFADKDRVKNKSIVNLRNFKTFPRPVLVFRVENEKIVSIKNDADNGRDDFWGGY